MKFLTVIFIFVISLSFAPSSHAAAIDNSLRSGLVFDSIIAKVESDVRWDGASVEVNNLDLSALDLNGKSALIEGFDAIEIVYLGQVRPGKRFTMRVTFIKQKKVLTDALLTAKIRAFKEVVVAVRSLRIRDKVGPGDVRIERMELRDINAPLFTSLSDVIGMRVRRPIRAGAFVKRSYIDPETLMRRGEMIVVVADNGILRIRTKARALKDGYPGSVVEARTVGGKVVFGTVTRRGELSVSF
jgi:flagella basal body P-ring formation protein FlgA